MDQESGEGNCCDRWVLIIILQSFELLLRKHLQPGGSTHCRSSLQRGASLMSLFPTWFWDGLKPSPMEEEEVKRSYLPPAQRLFPVLCCPHHCCVCWPCSGRSSGTQSEFHQYHGLGANFCTGLAGSLMLYTPMLRWLPGRDNTEPPVCACCETMLEIPYLPRVSSKLFELLWLSKDRYRFT